MVRRSYPTADDAMAALFVLEAFGINATMCGSTVHNPFGGDYTEWEVTARELPAERDNTAIAIPSPEPHEDDFQQSRWWDEYGTRWRRNEWE
jgi:hypothetical protein